MRRWWCGVLLVILVAVAALPLAVLLRGGISARTEPGGVEVTVARWVRSALIPPGAKVAHNPLTPSPRLLAEGRAHFADHCASCHANDGGGDTSLGRGLSPRAPDMRRAPTQDLTDGELFYLIENGVRFTGMPAWGGAGKPEESWKLVLFIRHLPTMTPEEGVEMERLNPKSPDEWRELLDESEFLEGKGNAPGPREHGRH